MTYLMIAPCLLVYYFAAVDGRLIFRCVTKTCAGRISTNIDYADAQEINSKHTHQPNGEKLKIREVKEAMKERAANTTDTIPHIYKKCTASLASNPDAAAIMPTLRFVEGAMYRKRRALIPQLPKSISELQIPATYASTSLGDTFLQYRSNDKDILIFFAASHLKLLCRAATICIDGTFDCVPYLFAQLFTLHIFMNQKLLPVVYCLLGSKSRNTYAEVFQFLKSKAADSSQTLSPTTIISDFETGVIAAVRDEFPNTQHRGCYLHNSQVCYKCVFIVFPNYSTQQFIELNDYIYSIAICISIAIVICISLYIS